MEHSEFLLFLDSGKATSSECMMRGVCVCVCGGGGRGG